MKCATLSAAILAGAMLVVGVGVGVGVGGCAPHDPVKAPYTPSQDLLTKTTYPKVTARQDLAPWLVVDNPTVQNDGVLKVSVPVRLTSSDSQWSKVQYRFIFLDVNNVPVRAQPDWVAVTMEPRQQVFMQGNSLDSDATDWRLEIRPQR